MLNLSQKKVSQQKIEAQKQKPQTIIDVTPTKGILQDVPSRLDTKLASAGASILAASQVISPIQAQPTEQALAQPTATTTTTTQASAQAQPSLFFQKPVTTTVQTTVQKTKTKTKPKAKVILKPKTKLKLPLLPPGVKNTPTVKKLMKLRQKGRGVNIQVGMKIGRERIIAKNLDPFTAVKKARKFVDRNIEASYRLIPSGKKATGRKSKPQNVGRKFRPSKVNPLFVVEKKKFRLDSPGERRQIKIGKKTVKKRKKKKK